MDRIGIRDLKERTSEILRRVREDGEHFEVTYHGKLIALIVPPGEKPATDDLARYWEEWDALARDLSHEWPSGLSAVDAIREDRDRL
jgi:prevent-host-death family protein